MFLELPFPKMSEKGRMKTRKRKSTLRYILVPMHRQMDLSGPGIDVKLKERKKEMW
jgi:hypothetical protein